MTNTISSTCRIASGLIAALTIVGGGLVGATGSAEAADYVVWRANFGATASTADSSDQGIVDYDDFAMWRD